MLGLWNRKKASDRERLCNEKIEASSNALCIASRETTQIANSILQQLRNPGNDTLLLCDLDGKVRNCADHNALFDRNAVDRPVSDLLGAEDVLFSRFWESLVLHPPESSVRMFAKSASGVQLPVDVTLTRANRQHHPAIVLLIRNLVNTVRPLHQQRVEETLI
jgi:hypothetical protein